MADNRQKKQKKQGKVKWIGIFTLFAVLLIGGLSAKYISEHKKDAGMTSSKFYFTSNYLETDTKKYDITDWSDGFDIELYNYDKDNESLVSEDDIEYTVSINNENWIYTDANKGKLKLGTDGNKNKQTIHIDPEQGAQKGDVITVTVKTTSPYQKTISATFTAVSSREPDYTIEDKKDGSVSLVIKTNDYEGSVNINWNQNIYDPDNTNKYMNDWKDSDQTKALKVEKNTTYQLLFFKNVTTDITGRTGSGTNIKMPES